MGIDRLFAKFVTFKESEGRLFDYSIESIYQACLPAYRHCPGSGLFTFKQSVDGVYKQLFGGT